MATNDHTALIYCRVSVDDDGSARSVEEQRIECERLCKERGLIVSEVLTDNDVGASRFSVGQRPEWERAKSLIGQGAVSHLVTWELSRLSREQLELEALAELVTSSGVTIIADGKEWDLADPQNRFMFTVSGSMNAYASAQTSQRVKRALRANAEAGRPHGKIPFGYDREYDPVSGEYLDQVPNDDAVTIRRIFSEYLQGSGADSISKGLNDDGLTTGTGSAWSATQVRRVLRNPTYAGIRKHRDELIHDAWTPVIPIAEWERTQAMLGQRSTRRRRSEETARMLSSVLVCGVCGGPMYSAKAAATAKYPQGRRQYVCHEKHCVARDMSQLDELMSHLIVQRLSMAGVWDQLTSDSLPEEPQHVVDARQKIANLNAKKDAARSSMLADSITWVEYEQVVRDINDLISEAEMITATPKVVAPTIDLPDHAPSMDYWKALSPSDRREWVNALVAMVKVDKTRRGERKFDPSKVSVEWRMK